MLIGILMYMLIFPYDDDIILISLRPSIGNYNEQQPQKQPSFTVKFM